MTWLARCLLQTVLVLACVQQAWNKGAKVRPGKRMSGKQAGRQGGGMGGSADGSESGGGFGGIYGTGSSHRNMSHEERLLAYLFREYDPVARAVMDTSKPVVVSVDFVLLRIHGLVHANLLQNVFGTAATSIINKNSDSQDGSILQIIYKKGRNLEDERSQVLTTTGLVIAEWKDDRLTWDPEDFGNLTDIIIKANKIWLPELAVMNGADELIPDFERIRVLLSNNGMLHWEPGGIFRTTCDIDITYFPFDTQHCPLLIGAYSYYSSKMNITNTSSEISTHDFRLNGEWHVYGTSTEWNITVLDCCPGKGYPHVVFTLHLKRRYKFYMMNIVLPCVMLSVLIMIGFFLPPDAGEKISLGISVLLAFTVFLLMIADNIPRTSLAIPLMVIYLTATMTLGTISICLTVLVLNVHHRGARYPVPHWLKRLVLIYLSRFVCVRSQVAQEMGASGHTKGGRRDKAYAKRMERMKKKNKKTPVEGNGVVDDMELLSLTVGHHHHHPHHNSRPSNGPRVVPVKDSTTINTTCDNHNLCTCGETPLAADDHGDTGEEPDYSRDWHEMAHVLDRLFFWLLFVGMTASAVFILLYPRYMGIVT